MSPVLSRALFGLGLALMPMAQNAVAMSIPAAQHWATPDRPQGNQVLVQYRRPENFNANSFRGNVTANRNTFVNSNHNTTVNSNRNVNVNSNSNVNVTRNVNVTNYGGSYGPNWGAVAAGVVVGAGIGVAASAAASARSYPPPPPYPYYYPPPY